MENKKKVLEKCVTVKQPKRNELISVLKELKQNSDKFPIKFPIETVRCKSLSKNVSESTLKNNIASTYPLIHEQVLRLYCSFLLYKRSYGSQKEKELYKDMDVVSLVDRLLLNRSVSFCGHGDHYILLTGKTGSLGWEKIGSDEEKEPLLLKNCLSYDEIKLSAMLYVSGPTVFINDGSRYNEGIVDSIDKNIEQQGIIMGLIGTRFEKKNTMECQEILINHSQNSHINGYGAEKRERCFDVQSGEFKVESVEDSKWLWRQVWAEFYNEPRLTFAEAIELYKEQTSNSKENIPHDYYTKRFVCNNDTLFDNTVYSKHISIAFDCAMLEASHRAKDQGKMAYLHVVGIGLGVWRAFFHQGSVFVKTFLERLKKLSPQLVGLSDVHFAYFREIPPEILPKDGTYIECESHPLGGIRVHICDREPSSKLTGEHENKLLVETYAWDGNAQPGNEFWSGNLSGSGDPAAACSSQVSELHNAHINTRFVCGSNLHVAGPHGVRHVGEYVQLMLESEN